MATDAKAILSHPRSTDRRLVDLLTWLRTTGPFLLLGFGAFAYAGTLLSGLRLFDNDYDWINQARDTGWLALAGDILRPIPESWGFQDRPVQVLVFKGLYGLFAQTAAGYYAFKAFLLAAVAVGITRLARTLHFGTSTALLAGAIFALSSPAHASALWVSDFELLAEVLILAALGQFWRMLESPASDRVSEWLNQVMFVLLAVVAHRTKGSAKLIPAIVLIYLFLYRRDQIRRFVPALALILLTIVPVSQVISEPLPPFAPFAEDQSQGWMWKPANTGTLATLVLGNFHPLWGTTGPEIAFSLLAVLSPALLWAMVAGAAYLAASRGKSCFTPATGLLTVWAAVAILSYASFPRLPEGFMARYVVVALVPVSLLIARIVTESFRDRRKVVVGLAVTTLLSVHAAYNFESTRHLRDTLGQVIVAYDQAREYISTRIQDSNVLIIGFSYGYNRERVDTNTYHREKLRLHSFGDVERIHVLVRTDQNLDAIEHQSTIQDIRKSVSLPRVDGKVRVNVRPIEMFPGLTDSFYDKHIYRSRQSFAGILYEMTFAQEQS